MVCQGKVDPRRLREVDADFANEFASAFQAAFENGAVEPVIHHAIMPSGPCRVVERLTTSSGDALRLSSV
jgi:hypothetical protein